MAPDPLAPNAEDQDGEYFDPWQALGLHCSAYSSTTDEAAIAVLKGIRDKLYSTDIAERAKLDETLVELLQEIFCSADWCEYGTSPRGCWFIEDGFGDRIITAWEAYYKRHWEGSE